FMLVQANSDEKMALWGGRYYMCHSLEIRARYRGQEVIGHAHLYPVDGRKSSAWQQYKWVLRQLSELDLTDIRIRVGINSSWEGFPKNIRLPQLRKAAVKHKIKMLEPVFRQYRELGNSADVITTLDASYMQFLHEDERADSII